MHNSLNMKVNYTKMHHCFTTEICHITILNTLKNVAVNVNINLCPVNRRVFGTTSHLAQCGNSCYEWFTGRASWKHAESNCVSHRGHLVQIKDANPVISEHT